MSVSRIVFVALLVLSVTQAGVYFPQLPDPMASHFDGSGRPNGWSSRASFFGIMLGMNALMAFVFLFAPFFNHRATRRAMSIPNREYWLAPERYADTLMFIKTRMVWMGVATLVLMVGITQMAIAANLGSSGTLTSKVGWLLAAYFVFVAGWLVHFVGTFLRVTDK